MGGVFVFVALVVVVVVWVHGDVLMVCSCTCTPTHPQAAPKPTTNNKYSWTQFVPKLQECKGVNPLPSDSRRRPDRAALFDGDGRAGELKHRVEEMQRAERRVWSCGCCVWRRGGGGGGCTDMNGVWCVMYVV